MDNQQSIALVWAHAFANAPAIPAGFHTAEENMTWPEKKPDPKEREALIEDISRATATPKEHVGEMFDEWMKNGPHSLQRDGRMREIFRRVTEHYEKLKAHEKERLWAKQQFELGRLFNWRRTFATKAVEGFRQIATTPAEAEEERA